MFKVGDKSSKILGIQTIIETARNSLAACDIKSSSWKPLLLDSIWGNKTSTALSQFQIMFMGRAEADGIYGPKTEKVLLEVYTEWYKNYNISDLRVTATVKDPIPSVSVDQMPDYPWIKLAKSFIGTSEIKGSKHNPDVVQFWEDIKRGGIKDDETPWCSAFVGAMFERCGIESTRFESAKSWATWDNGVRLDKPVYGCVVVFTRSGGGHVGFCVGEDSRGNLLILGGNQSDAVNVKAFTRDRVTAYMFPKTSQMIDILPVLSADDFEISSRED